MSDDVFVRLDASSGAGIVTSPEGLEGPLPAYPNAQTIDHAPLSIQQLRETPLHDAWLDALAMFELSVERQREQSASVYARALQEYTKAFEQQPMTPHYGLLSKLGARPRTTEETKGECQ